MKGKKVLLTHWSGDVRYRVTIEAESLTAQTVGAVAVEVHGESIAVGWLEVVT